MAIIYFETNLFFYTFSFSSSSKPNWRTQSRASIVKLQTRIYSAINSSNYKPAWYRTSSEIQLNNQLNSFVIFSPFYILSNNTHMVNSNLYPILPANMKSQPNHYNLKPIPHQKENPCKLVSIPHFTDQHRHINNNNKEINSIEYHELPRKICSFFA